jgi:dTDP-glucose 4,6-dehydratase
VDDRPGHDRRYALDTTKIRTRLGFTPRVRFDEGAERTIRWYSENRGWWEKVKSGAFREYYEKAYRL